MLRVFLFAALCAVAVACVIEPYHGKHIGTRSTPITFEIFATKANAALTVTCSHHYGNLQTIDTFVGGSSPITYAGETVYMKKRTITIPNSCWESWSGNGYTHITYIRVKQDDNFTSVFDQAGVDCVFEQIGDGVGPITAGFECQLDGKDILLYANP